MEIKRWTLPEVPAEQVSGLVEQTGLPPLVCRVLCARGYGTKDEYDSFFSDRAELDDPFLLKDMDRAVQRIHEAVEAGERIAVYGDYDCDGVTSTALLMSYFHSVGANAIFYIPSREKEGYGMHMESVKALADMDVRLIVTVDNGISAHEEILYAGTLGMDVVVTDHHTPRDTLPQAAAVVNPHRADCPSRFKGLAGVGVAFKLVCALEGDQGGEMLEYYSDLVALGTIADVVPLVGENRVLARHGLRLLCESERPGISALLAVSGLKGKPLTGESVAFGAIPRLNAAGRMGNVDDAVELLLTDDARYAKELAEILDAHNTRRKRIEEEILGEIDAVLKQHPDKLGRRLLVVSGKNWHHGIVGIAAAKMVERYGRPCILFSVDDGGEARGSGRSIEGFSLIEAITACRGELTQFGGHTLAAGLTLPAAGLERFDRDIQDWAARTHPVMPAPRIKADCALAPNELRPELLAPLSGLEPFGSANQQPVFLLSSLLVEGIYPTADKKHIRIRFTAGAQSFYAVYFRMTEDRFPHRPGDTVDVMANVSAGEYMGKPQVSVRVQDVRPPDFDQEAVLLDENRYQCFWREEPIPGGGDLAPDRKDLAVIYKYIRKCKTYSHGELGLYFRLVSAGIPYCKMMIGLDILEEMGLIQRHTSDAVVRISLVPGAAKVDLGASGILLRLRS